MSKDIEPALSAEEWQARKDSLLEPPRYLNPDDVPYWIAVLNDALPDDDERKITRESLAVLTFAATSLDAARLTASSDRDREIVSTQHRLRRIAAVLQSYLRRESPEDEYNRLNPR